MSKSETPELSRLPKTKEQLQDDQLIVEGQILHDLNNSLTLNPESNDVEQWFKASAVCRLQVKNYNKRNMGTAAKAYTEQANELELHGYRLLFGNKKEVIDRIRKLQGR